MEHHGQHKRPTGASERFAVKRSWHVYDGIASGTVVTVNNRIVRASPTFKRYVGQLIATLPRRHQVVKLDAEAATQRADTR
jgi:hypothetical protein